MVPMNASMSRRISPVLLVTDSGGSIVGRLILTHFQQVRAGKPR